MKLIKTEQVKIKGNLEYYWCELINLPIRKMLVKLTTNSIQNYLKYKNTDFVKLQTECGKSILIIHGNPENKYKSWQVKLMNETDYIVSCYSTLLPEVYRKKALILSLFNIITQLQGESLYIQSVNSGWLPTQIYNMLGSV